MCCVLSKRFNILYKASLSTAFTIFFFFFLGGGGWIWEKRRKSWPGVWLRQVERKWKQHWRCVMLLEGLKIDFFFNRLQHSWNWRDSALCDGGPYLDVCDKDRLRPWRHPPAEQKIWITSAARVCARFYVQQVAAETRAGCLFFFGASQLKWPSWFSSDLSLWGLFWCQALCVLYILQHSLSINSRPWICGAQTSHEDSCPRRCRHIYRQRSYCVQSRIVSRAHSGLVKP